MIANQTVDGNEVPGRHLLGRVLESPWFLPAALCLLTLAQFGDILFGPGHNVISDQRNDLAEQFYAMRSFGFSELKAGRLALWNPYLYSGIPFMGGWQSALLYPPNWIYLFLPLERAINSEIAISVFLAGLGVALWARFHGMHPAAALLSGTMAMFGGSFFLSVNGGHLPNVDTMAWTPFVLLAVDGILASVRPMATGGDTPPTSSAPLSLEGRGAGGEGSSLKWALLAAFALAMQVLAGHPQTLFNTIVTIIIYMAIRIAATPRLWPAALILAASGVTAVAMTSVQIVTGLAAAGEGVRRAGLDYGSAGTYSFPPENFVTALVPRFFGDFENIAYWGRGYYWEMCVYVGIAGLGLAIYGLIHAKSGLKRQWAVMAFLLLWMALGAHTPLFWLMYHLPGFNRFRGHSKFDNNAMLFLCLAAGGGMDSILRGGRTRALAALSAIAGALLIIFGLCLHANVLGIADGSPWQQFLLSLWQSNEMSGLPGMPGAAFLAQSQSFAGTECLIYGGIALLFAAIAAIADWKPGIGAGAMVGFAVIELFVFAHLSWVTFDPATIKMPALSNLIASDPGDYRVLLIDFPNMDEVTEIKASDVWGYDPAVLGRYAELMTFGETGSTKDAGEYLDFPHPSPFFKLFRMRYYALASQPNNVYQSPNPLPHAFLVNQVLTRADRASIFSAMSDPHFDFARTVVLEAPSPLGATGMSGSVTPADHIDVSENYPGNLTIHADLTAPAIAVITDSYSRNWHATALAGSSQSHYEVLPADYAAMAIPLDPGTHNIQLAYVPNGFYAAAWVSGVATALFLALVSWTMVGAAKRGIRTFDSREAQ